jgi:hypothetical protein
MEHQETSQFVNPVRPKGLLYHYTTLDGLIGILDTDCLRATHIRYMNDSKEFINALEHLDDIVNELPPVLRPGLKSFMSSVLPFIDGRNSAYIISFTDDNAQQTSPNQCPGDRLSQWRAYSSNGKGVSMGFDYDSIDKSNRGTIWPFRGSTVYFLNCLYTEDEKQRAFKGVGELVAKDFHEYFTRFWPLPLTFMEGAAPPLTEKCSKLDEVDEIPAIRATLLMGLTINATTFKDNAFNEEKEWRVVVLLSRHNNADLEKSQEMPVKFRSGAIGITPYIEFPLELSTPKSPLRRIVVGPAPHMEQAVKGVEMLLEGKGIRLKRKDFPDGVEVVPSNIPYRNW